MSVNHLQIVNDRLIYLQSWTVKGIWLLPGTDLRVQIVDWDKLLEYIIKHLILPQHPEFNNNYDLYDTTLSKIIHTINTRPFSIQTKYNDKEIRWAHRMRNAVVHDIFFDFNNEKQKNDICKSIEILEETCKHIIKYYDLENNWEILEEDYIINHEHINE